MAIVYRTTGAWGAGQGSDLSAAQIDGNFYDIDVRVAAIETNPPSPDELVSVTLSGSDLSFHLLSGAVLGPVTVTLPRFRDRGGFVGGDIYAVNDTFTADGVGLVVVLVDHTAAATFDENAEAVPATNAGSFIIGRRYIIDTIGTTDFTLIGAASNTVGLSFRASGVGSGTGTASLKLYDVMVRVQEVPYSPVSTVAGSGSPPEYVLVLTDAGKYLRITNAADVTVTIPVEASVDFDVGTEIAFEQSDTGAVGVVGAVGVTLNCAATHTAVTNGLWAVAQIKKVAVDEWIIFGNLVQV